MTTPLPAGDDPYRRAVAAHELGHAYAWSSAGFIIVSITITGDGPHAYGYVELDGEENTTTEENRAYLVGLLAGRVAEEKWCKAAGLRVDLDYRSRVDMERYRKARREPAMRGISDRMFRSAAVKLVDKHWKKIQSGVPTLSTRGSIDIKRRV